jgi:hypothetical protein
MFFFMWPVSATLRRESTNELGTWNLDFGAGQRLLRAKREPGKSDCPAL